MRAHEVLEQPAVQERIRKVKEHLPTKPSKVAALECEMERREALVAYYELFGEEFGTPENLVNTIYPRHADPAPARKAIAVVITKVGDHEMVVETDFNVGPPLRVPGGPTDLGFAWRAAKAIALRHGIAQQHIVADGFDWSPAARDRLDAFNAIGGLVMLLDMPRRKACRELARMLAEGVVIEPCELAYLAARGVNLATA